jgi:hypothetical protein
MLTYVLALAVGLGSFGLYMAAFFFPEVHRKYDLIWSGVGLFYALVLWVCAGRITGGVLLGQLASVALLGWFGWQTLKLRREQTPLSQQTQLPGSATSLSEVIQDKTRQLQVAFQQGVWKSSLPLNGKKLMKQLKELMRDLRAWVEALLSTTMQSRPSAQPFPKPDKATPSSSNGSTQSSKANSSKVEVATVLIETEGTTATPSLEPEAEVQAEWDDLEVETYPELDTVDGFSPLQPLEQVEPRHDASTEHSRGDSLSSEDSHEISAIAPNDAVKHEDSTALEERTEAAATETDPLIQSEPQAVEVDLEQSEDADPRA